MYDPIEMLLLKLCVQLQHRAWPWIWPQNLLHLPVSQCLVKPNSETHSDTLPFGWETWTGYTTSFKPRHSAQLIAQCWLQGVLIEVKFIGWMKKKRREEKAEEVFHDETQHPQTLLQGNVLCSFMRSHNQKQSSCALSMAFLHTSP